VNSDPNHCTKALASESGPLELERHQCGFDITAVRHRSTRAKEFTVWRYYPSCVRLATCRAAELVAIRGDRGNFPTSLTSRISLICGGRARAARSDKMSEARRAFSNQLNAVLLVLAHATSPLPAAGQRSPPTFARRNVGAFLFVAPLPSRFAGLRRFQVISRDVALAFRPASFSAHASCLPFLFVAQLPSRSAGLRLFPVISRDLENPQD